MHYLILELLVVYHLFVFLSSGRFTRPSLLLYGVHNHESVAAHSSYTPTFCRGVYVQGMVAMVLWVIN